MADDRRQTTHRKQLVSPWMWNIPLPRKFTLAATTSTLQEAQLLQR